MAAPRYARPALNRDFLAAEQPGVAGTLASIGDSIMFLVAPPIAVVALVMRYRRSFGVAREQLRWLTFAIVVARWWASEASC